jgi:hypothetical protein
MGESGSMATCAICGRRLRGEGQWFGPRVGPGGTYRLPDAEVDLPHRSDARCGQLESRLDADRQERRQDEVPQHLSMARVIGSGEVQPADEDELD